jgi:hypothetical protein
LTDDDKIAIATALNTSLNRTFTDSRAEEACAEMEGHFRLMWNAGKVFRGISDTEEGDQGIGPHFGAWHRGTRTIHIDPSFLDAAQEGGAAALREIANTSLHEAAHDLEYEHTSAVRGFYMEAPFKYLSPGTNSCLTF